MRQIDAVETRLRGHSIAELEGLHNRVNHQRFSLVTGPIMRFNLRAFLSTVVDGVPMSEEDKSATVDVFQASHRAETLTLLGMKIEAEMRRKAVYGEQR